MSFKAMRERLDQAYSQNVSRARIQELLNDGAWMIGDRPDTTRRIPILNGMSGIGKTACVKAFAEDHDFELLSLDCSYMPASTFAAAVQDASQRIDAGKLKGCVLLVDNADGADEEWQELLLQYAQSRLDTVVKASMVEKPGRMGELTVHVERIPESLFVVGEQRLTA